MGKWRQLKKVSYFSTREGVNKDFSHLIDSQFYKYLF